LKNQNKLNLEELQKKELELIQMKKNNEKEYLLLKNKENQIKELKDILLKNKNARNSILEKIEVKKNFENLSDITKKINLTDIIQAGLNENYNLTEKNKMNDLKIKNSNLDKNDNLIKIDTIKYKNTSNKSINDKKNNELKTKSLNKEQINNEIKHNLKGNGEKNIKNNIINTKEKNLTDIKFQKNNIHQLHSNENKTGEEFAEYNIVFGHNIDSNTTNLKNISKITTSYENKKLVNEYNNQKGEKKEEDKIKKKYEDRVIKTDAPTDKNYKITEDKKSQENPIHSEIEKNIETSNKKSIKEIKKNSNIKYKIPQNKILLSNNDNLLYKRLNCLDRNHIDSKHFLMNIEKCRQLSYFYYSLLDNFHLLEDRVIYIRIIL